MSSMELQIHRDYDLPASALWPIVANLSGYAAHVGGLRSTVATGDGPDETRVCTDVKGRNWSERVSAWEEGHSYQVDVDTASYPIPLRQLFRRFTGTWTVEPRGESCRVTIRFDADVRAPFGPIVRLMAKSSADDLEQTLASYGRAAAQVAS